MKYLLLLVFLVSCGTDGIRKPDYFYHPELVPYLDAFLEDAEYYGTTLQPEAEVRVLDFGDAAERYPDHVEKSESRAGVCIYGSSTKYLVNLQPVKNTDWQEVLINPEIDEFFLRELLYHEFGHCYLKKDHSDNPYDIMYPYITGKATLDWENAVERFFTNTEL